MRGKGAAALLLSAVTVAGPALAGGRHHHGRGLLVAYPVAHERVLRYEPVVVVRTAPVVVVQAAPARYWREPARYYYHEPRHEGHHDHDDSYKWIAAAAVLGEIIHHAP